MPFSLLKPVLRVCANLPERAWLARIVAFFADFLFALTVSYYLA